MVKTARPWAVVLQCAYLLGGCAADMSGETIGIARTAQRDDAEALERPERAPCRVMRIDSLAWHDGTLEAVGCGFAQLLEVRIYPAALEAPSRAVPWVAADDRHLRIYAGEPSAAASGEVWFVGETRQIQRFFPWGAP